MDVIDDFFHDYYDIDTPFLLEPSPLHIDAFVAVSPDDHEETNNFVPFDRMKKSSTMPMK